MKRFDYIIAGGGLSGLSLAFYLNRSVLKNKSVLIIDREQKNQNDRTWSFWEKRGEGNFDNIAHKIWDSVWFHGTNYSAQLNMGEYQYKWLRGIDFYAFVLTQLQQNPCIKFLQSNIKNIEDTPNGGVVVTDTESYVADYVFDSTFALNLGDSKNQNLLQHFKGWIIETKQPTFDDSCATMMDYRVQQRGLGVRFMYVLPESPTKAMIEFTAFSEKLLPDAEYDSELDKYIRELWKINDFEIVHSEFGIIPMSDVPAPMKVGAHVFRIGTSGGFVKPSSGYAFKRTQVFTQQIVENLIENKSPEIPVSFFKKLLDSTLLNVLLRNEYSGKDIFTDLYKNNSTPLLFKFLDEQTSFVEDVRVMNSVPIWPFLKSFLYVMRK
jgi:lycopene beta-cyclase